MSQPFSEGETFTQSAPDPQRPAFRGGTRADSCGDPEYTFANDLQVWVELNIEARSRNIYEETHSNIVLIV